MKLDKEMVGQGAGVPIEAVFLKDGILNKRKRGWLLRISFRY